MSSSGRKQPGGDSPYESVPGRRVTNVLDGDARAILRLMRCEVGRAIGQPDGSDLGADSRSGVVQFMPAFKRYDGNLYRQIPSAVWQGLTDSGFDVVVVSALNGLLFWDEPIGDYNAAMNNKPWPGVRLCTWWRKRGLPLILSELISGMGYVEVCDFLSGNYRAAVDGYQDGLRNIRFHCPNYGGWGSGADYHRGSDISRLLQKI